MKAIKFLAIGSLILLVVAVPAAADAHGGGLAVLGFGLGLFTGLAVAPGVVYGGPVYYAPPPPVIYPSYPVSAYVTVPAPSTPPSYGYSRAIPPPSGKSTCREWSLINRRWEKRWDPNFGRWRNVLVEKWGWVAVPCQQ